MPTASAAVFSNSIKSTDAPATLALFAERRSAGSWWDSAGRTIVQSASEAEDLIGHQRRRFHFKDIVNADYVRSAQDRRRNRRRRGALQKAFRGLFQLRQKGFSRRTHYQRKFQRRERAQPCQDFGVLLFPLAKSQAGVDGDARAIHAGANRAMRGRIQILPDGPHHVFDG